MYFGLESFRSGKCAKRLNGSRSLEGAAFGITAVGLIPGWDEKLDELFGPLLPGSEQFRLQQRRAIETAGVFFAASAFLQQSDIFVIGHEPS